MNALPSFDLHRPTDLLTALTLLDQHRSDAKLIAGGTDFVVNLRHGLETPGHVVALSSIPELNVFDADSKSGLRLGALTTVDTLATDPRIRSAYPVLSEAAASVSGPTLRRMGTLGGNLCLDTRCQWYNQSPLWREACGFCLKKEGTVCHVAPGSELCWAVYSGDIAPALLTLDAELVLQHARGERRVPLSKFYFEDGLRKYDLGVNEILTEVRVPASRAGLAGSYHKLRSRAAVDYPLAGVAVSGRVTGTGTLSEVAIGVTAIGPCPMLVREATRFLEGKNLADERLAEVVVEMARRTANPLHTGGGLSPAYRRLRVGLFARDGVRALTDKLDADV